MFAKEAIKIEIDEAMAISSKQDMETARFRLVTTKEQEVKKLFTATFKKLQSLRQAGYSIEAQKPYKIALLEILVELRVRGMEADFEGKIYCSPIFHPVPKIFAQALKRQIIKMRYMDECHREHLCQKALTAIKQNAARFGKTASTTGV